MDSFVRVADLQNEIEAIALDAALTEHAIPHGIRSFHDSALDGLYQRFWGWGFVEAPANQADEIRDLLAALRAGMNQP